MWRRTAVVEWTPELGLVYGFDGTGKTQEVGNSTGCYDWISVQKKNMPGARWRTRQCRPFDRLRFRDIPRIFASCWFLQICIESGLPDGVEHFG